MSFRTAENVRVPSFDFRSLSFVSFWSGQLIVPASLSPSFLIVKVDVRCCPPISYSHFHVPTASTALSSTAPARPHTPSTNAIETIAFMIASEKWRREAVQRRPPPAADSDCMDAATVGQVYVAQGRSCSLALESGKVQQGPARQGPREGGQG